MCIIMEREYGMEGTPQAVQDCLMKEFHTTEDEAKFIMAVLLEAERETEEMREECDEVWQYDSSVPHSTPFFNTRISISFKEITITFLRRIFIEILGGGKVDDEGIRKSVAAALINNNFLYYIDDSLCCIYFKILKWKMHNLGKKIYLTQIYELYMDEGCDYSEKEWMCPYRRVDSCIFRKGEIDNLLKILCDKKVLRRDGDGFDFYF